MWNRAPPRLVPGYPRYRLVKYTITRAQVRIRVVKTKASPRVGSPFLADLLLAGDPLRFPFHRDYTRGADREVKALVNGQIRCGPMADEIEHVDEADDTR